jgi:hypothetical protein
MQVWSAVNVDAAGTRYSRARVVLDGADARLYDRAGHRVASLTDVEVTEESKAKARLVGLDGTVLAAWTIAGRPCGC